MNEQETNWDDKTKEYATKKLVRNSSEPIDLKKISDILEGKVWIIEDQKKIEILQEKILENDLQAYIFYALTGQLIGHKLNYLYHSGLTILELVEVLKSEKEQLIKSIDCLIKKEVIQKVEERYEAIPIKMLSFLEKLPFNSINFKSVMVKSKDKIMIDFFLKSEGLVDWADIVEFGESKSINSWELERIVSRLKEGDVIFEPNAGQFKKL